jgi:DNA polymerase III subunit gamma/tau
MSYLVLARKYRPQTFAEVLEQEHVTRTLGNAIASGRVAHAILFTGPRGTGKTTVARILAKALNCQGAAGAEAPCNRCRSCIEITGGNAADVFEIDGASNNSVDQVRELRENVKYTPAHSRYKIYIIDEVHMLSTPAFNALLKTLEEPPAHVLFMFATTEPHKIPITILSRCQRYDFRRVRLASIIAHLSSICRREEVEIAPESLELIARESGGSVRDSLSLLDQVIAGGQRSVPHEQVLETLGVVDRSRLHDLAGAVADGDARRFLQVLDELFERGHDVKKLYADLLDYFRDLWVVQATRAPETLVDLPGHEIALMQDKARAIPTARLEHVFDTLFREEPAVRLSLQPKLAFEMAFFRVLQGRPVLSIDTLIAKLDDLRREVGGAEEASAGPTASSPKAPAPAARAAPTARPAAPVPDPELAAPPPGDLAARWQRISDDIARTQPNLGANLKRCCLKAASAERVEIATPNAYAASTLRRDKNLALLRGACARVFGGSPEIVIAEDGGCEPPAHGRREHKHAVVKETLNHPVVADAIDIFNGKLVEVHIPPEDKS